MKFIILTLFPEMFAGPLDHSIIKRAQDKNLLSIELVNIRDFSTDKHHSVDDRPYGGGKGMVMKVDVMDRALHSVKQKYNDQKTKRVTILLDPRGTPYTQKTVQKLSTFEIVILICGHYEGVDERIRSLVDMTISIGDFVLTGGELPAMSIVDSICRLVPGVLPGSEVSEKESFTTNVLEYPQYTRPETYKGMSVPPILLSGDPKKIDVWQKEQGKEITEKNRPDLLKQ